VAALLRFVGKPLRQVTLADLVAWGETLNELELAPASRARKLGAMKSLAAFGHRIGYLAFDIGAPLRLPAVKTALALEKKRLHSAPADLSDLACGAAV
jgi:integrase/recombinase XerD